MLSYDYTKDLLNLQPAVYQAPGNPCFSRDNPGFCVKSLRSLQDDIL